MGMKIPFFYGEDKVDSVNINEMIKNSADAMGLVHVAQKCKMFRNYLR
jgi:hypothetical protein